MKNLMLREDVVEAVREGKFHVYPVSTIDEGIGLLPASRRGSGKWMVDIQRTRQLRRSGQAQGTGRKSPGSLNK